MQVDIDTLFRAHETGRLRHSTHSDRDLHVWCYSQQTVYERDWDDTTLLCRGLVTTSDGTVVSRPFRKFFNWGEPLAPGPEVTSKPFWAFDKMDGTLIVVGLDPAGDVVVSTKGSFTTWHSEMAAKFLAGFTPVPGSTAIFELIGPSNQIVCKYPEDELVLLGAVAIETGEDHFTPENYADESGWFGSLAPPRAFNLASMLRTVQDPENGENREGFVLVWPNPTGPSDRVKIKFAQYVHLHATLSRINNVSIWEALRDGLFDALLEIVPDEVYDRVRECADDLIGRHETLVRRVYEEAAVATSGRTTRKEQAEWVLSNATVPTGLVFKALDRAQDVVARLAWEEVKPVRDETWTFLK